MTAGRPTCALLQKGRMGSCTNVNLSGAGRPLHLRVTAQTEIRVVLDQHHAVDRTMRVVANGAPLAQSFVLENERTRLFTMALRAGLILLRHSQPTRRFKNVAAVRIMALYTTHVSLNHRMMRGQTEFRARLQMTAKARLRTLAGIDDEFTAPPADFDMSAAGTVTGFTTHFGGHRRVGERNSRVRTGPKSSRDVGVTIEADLIADVVRARNL